MSTKIAISLLGSLLYSTAQAATDMPKDEWLPKLKAVAPATICKSFTENEEVNKQMIKAKLDYDKCLTLIPPMFDKCQTKYYAEIPDKLDKVNAEKWGGSIGECIGSDFAVSYFLTNSATKPSTEPTTSPTEKKDESKTTTSAPASKDEADLSKDEWLNKLKLAAPELICKEFLKDGSLSKQLEKLNINYDKCINLIPASIDKCRAELYDKIPTTFSKEEGEKWGTTIGECIGKDFAIKYLLPSSPKS